MNQKEIKEAREKWATALESGEFHQCSMRLTSVSGKLIPKPDIDSFCCLGVAQYLFGKDEFDYSEADKAGAGLSSFCSLKVRRILGISSTECQELVDLNDNQGKDFKEIARAVRALPSR